MDLLNLASPTEVVRPGTSVATVFEACVSHNVPGLPYIDEDDRISAKVSIRHIMKQTIPDYLVKAAHLLGDNISSLNIPPVQTQGLLAQSVEEFLLPPIILSRRTPVIKALAVMEHHNSSYVFVADDGRYEGIVTRMSIARRMLETGKAHKDL